MIAHTYISICVDPLHNIRVSNVSCADDPTCVKKKRRPRDRDTDRSSGTNANKIQSATAACLYFRALSNLSPVTCHHARCATVNGVPSPRQKF
jgi:hypothetical protein